MSVTPPTAAPIADRRRARRGVLLFVGLVAVLDVLLMTVTVMTGDARWIFALMWSVAAASVICRLALREGFRDVSFRFGGLRTLAFVVAGFAFPIVFGAVVYGIAWISGLATYVSPQGGFLLMLLSAVTVGAAINMLLAAGEEIGWRGYLLTRMIDAGIPRPVLVGGVIWALWHVPGIVAGVYLAGSGSSRLLTVMLFICYITAFAFVFARFRLATGSIWPAIVLHGAWNSIIQGPFDGSTGGANAALWTGEGGILVMLGMVGVAVGTVFVRPWRMLRSPGDPIVTAP
jgi:uncharacterized protein